MAAPPHPDPRPAPIDLRRLAATPIHELLALHARHINPAYAATIKTIGYDRDYVRAEGQYLYDRDGRRYLDCFAGYAVHNCGRNHPVIRDAVAQALDLDLPSLPAIGPFRLAPHLARELLELAPPPLTKAYFANSGAEAVDAAIKFARAFTGRPTIVYCDDAYHGLTIGALSVNANPEFRDGFGPLLTDTRRVPFDDVDALAGALAPGDVAAVIVEPIQGKGVNIPGDDYLASAHALCRRHGVLLIADEIQTGMARTGRMFACEHWGLEPDIMLLGKALSGGYVPVSAVLTRDDVHEAVFSSMSNCSRIQSTFSMNDPAMAAGLATLHVLRSEALSERADRMGRRIAETLRETLLPLDLVADVRAKGLMIGVEFRRPERGSLRLAWDTIHKVDPSLFCQAILIPLLRDHAVLAQVAGHGRDVIKLTPPLLITEADCDHLCNALRETIGACHAFPGPVGRLAASFAGVAMKRRSGARSPQIHSRPASPAPQGDPIPNAQD